VKKIICLFILGFLATSPLSAQGGSILALKDRGVIVRSYVSGSYINFELSNHQWLTAVIDKIQTDSIHLNLYSLRATTTAYGTWGEDTLQLGQLTVHFAEIISIAHERGHYTSVFTNGALLKVAGPLYAGLNISNSIINKEPVLGTRNISQIAGGVAAWLIGNWQAKKNPNYRPIGKRFTIEVIL
jgi:hypothetical protein